MNKVEKTFQSDIWLWNAIIDFIEAFSSTNGESPGMDDILKANLHENQDRVKFTLNGLLESGWLGTTSNFYQTKYFTAWSKDESSA